MRGRYNRRRFNRRRNYRRRLARPIGGGAVPLTNTPTRTGIVRGPRGGNRGGAPLRGGPYAAIRINALGQLTDMLSRTRNSRSNDDSPGTGSVSSFKWNRSNPDRLTADLFKQFAGTLQHTTQTANNASSTSGRQNAVVLGGLMTKAQIQELKDKVYGVTSSSTDSLQRTLKLYLKHCVARYYIRNQNNFPIKLRLYTCKVIRDCPTSSLDGPTEAWAKGYIDEEDTRADQSTVIGQTPRMSDEFRRYFQIVKTDYLDLAPGQFHEHKVFYNIRKMLSTTTVDNLNSQSLKSWTFYTMAVWHGALGNETAASDRVTFCPAKIDYAQTTTVSWSYLFKNNSDIKMVSKFEELTGLEQMADTSMGTNAPGNTDG